jgi:hypothetical protein
MIYFLHMFSLPHGDASINEDSRRQRDLVTVPWQVQTSLYELTAMANLVIYQTVNHAESKGVYSN